VTIPCMAPLERAFRAYGEERILFFDYDGTLAPFQEDRSRAYPYEGVRERLEELHRRGVELVFVTGRNPREIPDFLQLPFPVEVWGAHGGERLTLSGEVEALPLPPEQSNFFRTVGEAMEKIHPSLVEYKTFSVAFHLRPLKNEEERRNFRGSLERFDASAQEAGVHKAFFDGGIEYRSPLTGKDKALNKVLEGRKPPFFAAYFGDDTTDEDAFDALRGRGVSFLVRSRWRPTGAECWLTPPEELCALLDCFVLWTEKRW